MYNSVLFASSYKIDYYIQFKYKIKLTRLSWFGNIGLRHVNVFLFKVFMFHSPILI